MKNFKMKKFIITFLAVFVMCVAYNGVNGTTEAKAARNIKNVWRVDVQSSLIVRDKASTKGNKLGSLYKNNVVVGKDQGNGWIKLQATNSKGKAINAYISKTYAKPIPESWHVKTVTANTLNGRSRPTTKGNVLATYKKGERLNVNTACKVNQDGYTWCITDGCDEMSYELFINIGNGNKVQSLQWIAMKYVK